jgi:hypothetical protein
VTEHRHILKLTDYTNVPETHCYYYCYLYAPNIKYFFYFLRRCSYYILIFNTFNTLILIKHFYFEVSE